MHTMTATRPRVIAGIDTHCDQHVVATLDTRVARWTAGPRAFRSSRSESAP